MKEKGVYRKMPRREAIRKGIKIVKSRWVDINKGDAKSRNSRSRVVAQEYNDGKDIEEDMFAATPPLEA